MPRIPSEDEAWAAGGGRFEQAHLPAWVQTDAIVPVANDFAVFTNTFSRDCRRPVTIGLTNDHGLRPMAVPCSGDVVVCMVPVGLVVRVDYLMRLLERQCHEDSIHVVDPSFYGDLPEPMQKEKEQAVVPFPLDMFVDRKMDVEAFWAAFKFLDSVDEFGGGLGRSSYRRVQIDLVRMGMCFVALHEAAHAVRHHSRILAKSTNREADARTVEIDADYNAGRWLAFARCEELRTNVGLSNPRFFDALAESSWRITYACAVILGLFDLVHHDRVRQSEKPEEPLLAIGEFSTGDYHHPSIRLMLIANSMLNGFRNGAGIARDEEMTTIVEMSAEGARAYMSRITAVWLKNDPTKKGRRPTSLYFPLGLKQAKASAMGVSVL